MKTHLLTIALSVACLAMPACAHDNKDNTAAAYSAKELADIGNKAANAAAIFGVITADELDYVKAFGVLVNETVSGTTAETKLKRLTKVILDYADESNVVTDAEVKALEASPRVELKPDNPAGLPKTVWLSSHGDSQSNVVSIFRIYRHSPGESRGRTSSNCVTSLLGGSFGILACPACS